MKTARRAWLAGAALAVLTLGGCAASSKDGWRVASPDEKIGVELRQDQASGQLAYRVSFDPDGDGPMERRQLVDWSDLGLLTSGEGGQSDFSSGLTFRKATRETINDAYTLVTGKRLENSAQANALSLLFVDAETGAPFRIDWRAYNGGVAFRYSFAAKSKQTIESEATTFAIPEGGTHFSHPHDKASQWGPGYESPHTFGLPIGSPPPGEESVGWAFPSLFAIGDDWLLLSESDLNAGGYGSHLAPEASGGVYRMALAPADEGQSYGDPKPVVSADWTSAWRMMIIGDDLGDIVESNLVFDLATPSKVADPSWIKPGVSTWSWWSDHASSKSEPKLRNFIDLAAELKLPYSLVDANWNLISETSLEDLTRYADQKNVKLLFWYNSGGPINIVTEQPRDRLFDPEVRKREFAMLERLGVAGIKVDFFQSDKREVIDLYHGILEDAAAHKLLVVFHGSTMPRGWQRTYPNLMSMESVRGAEFYTFNSTPPYGAYAARANTVIPFTRNVLGSMDYTPVVFSKPMIKRETTNGHEAALGVIFESGIQHLADSVQSYRAQPAEVKAYLSHLETVWDETRYLSGYPGRDIVLARRRGSKWYIAGINGERTDKVVSVPVDYLPAGAKAKLIEDGDRPQSWKFSEVAIDPGTPLSMTMKPFGGFVIQVGE